MQRRHEAGGEESRSGYGEMPSCDGARRRRTRSMRCYDAIPSSDAMRLEWRRSWSYDGGGTGTDLGGLDDDMEARARARDGAWRRSWTT
jgi:hypothetical protein